MNNVSRKAASLHQSMEQWIDLYRGIHECSHDEAHDAFDEWADKLTGASADQTTAEFHDAVIASCAELKQKQIQAEPPLPKLRGGPLLELPYGARQPRRLQFGKAEFGGPAEVTFPDNPPIGGPILETGHDPLSFKDSYKEENVHWGQKTTYHETDVSALEERVVKELLGCSNPMPKIDTAEEARVKAEKAIEVNTSFLVNTKHPHDHPSVVKAREVIAAARTFLMMLGGVEERTKGRKTLSLPKK
jgi:hypothetical protein